jgi:hypothetical protein
MEYLFDLNRALMFFVAASASSFGVAPGQHVQRDQPQQHQAAGISGIGDGQVLKDATSAIKIRQPQSKIIIIILC